MNEEIEGLRAQLQELNSALIAVKTEKKQTVSQLNDQIKDLEDQITAIVVQLNELTQRQNA